jgi:hypothetical protein
MPAQVAGLSSSVGLLIALAFRPWEKQVLIEGIQPLARTAAQLGLIGAMQPAGVGDGLGAEVEAGGAKAQLGQQVGLMAPAGIPPQTLLQR